MKNAVAALSNLNPFIFNHKNLHEWLTLPTWMETSPSCHAEQPFNEGGVSGKASAPSPFPQKKTEIYTRCVNLCPYTRKFLSHLKERNVFVGGPLYADTLQSCVEQESFCLRDSQPCLLLRRCARLTQSLPLFSSAIMWFMSRSQCHDFEQFCLYY